MSGCNPFRIVVAEPYSSEAVSCLEEVGTVTLLDDAGPESLMSAVATADALLVRTKAHVTAKIINSAPNLKVIGRASPTMDHIDLRAAKRRDIHVVYSPRAAVDSSAEFTLALMLAMHRRLCFYDTQLRKGNFDTVRQPAGHELGRKTVGLLGIDPVADRLGGIISTAFGSRLIYHDPFGQRPTGFEGEAVGLDALLQNADILSIHLRLAPETRGLINAGRLREMKPSAILINTSRGAVVDNKALAEALEKEALAGAALDVFESEPLPGNHPLRDAPNCILTPHISGATLDATAGRFNVAEDVVRVLKGEAPKYPVAMPSV